MMMASRLCTVSGETRIDARRSVPMPRFFFHLREGANLIEDPDGLELDDLNAAIASARADVLALTAELVSTGKPITPRVIVIEDEHGIVRGGVSFRDVVFDLIKPLKL